MNLTKNDSQNIKQYSQGSRPEFIQKCIIQFGARIVQACRIQRMKLYSRHVLFSGRMVWRPTFTKTAEACLCLHIVTEYLSEY